MSVWYEFRRFKQNYLLELYEKKKKKDDIICLSQEVQNDGKRLYFLAFEKKFIKYYLSLPDLHYCEVNNFIFKF